ncbi:uncharacterized protein K460DRAFT_410760 [Cucurbitaria berberidis CBS 394.84]|uniref:Uncharacterized protein n=1 Tax=Cucurbitaria berberidis CBS 394.84 TaxID=1168544 RepID=A0A9P4G7H8_9PLEO|nr:uncharacterized protein K460DRAFT_410760 [Cucurbitaria berberidis CBS 394.84]KAF1840159.1 hypothetical protein K460DRAFT_410760 [Cucurbitaria berberidis CBS 394.84]
MTNRSNIGVQTGRNILLSHSLLTRPVLILMATTTSTDSLIEERRKRYHRSSKSVQYLRVSIHPMTLNARQLNFSNFHLPRGQFGALNKEEANTKKFHLRGNQLHGQLPSADCGVNLYGDFARNCGVDLDRLASSFQDPIPSPPPSSQVTQSACSSKKNLKGNTATTASDSQGPKETGTTPPEETAADKPDGNNKKLGEEDKCQNLVKTADGQRFFALCINTGGHKKLSEIPLANIKSDEQLFLEMKKRYREVRGHWSRINFLVKPKTFKLWSFFRSYIAVLRRPDCLPPNTDIDYEPGSALPPSEAFLHYLDHGIGKIDSNRNIWLDILPKRLIEHPPGCKGYGVLITEGPNHEGIFIVSMVVLTCIVFASILWSVVKKHVQGGTGIGTLLVACHAIFLKTWIAWRSGD